MSSLGSQAPLLVLVALPLLLPASARAVVVDDEGALVCDLAELAQCDGAAQCRKVTAAQIDLPPVFFVEFAASRLASEDGQRTSPINASETLESVILLQGHRDGRGWTLVIDRTNGHLTGTLADAQGSFVLGGACTKR